MDTMFEKGGDLRFKTTRMRLRSIFNLRIKTISSHWRGLADPMDVCFKSIFFQAIVSIFFGSQQISMNTIISIYGGTFVEMAASLSLNTILSIYEGVY